MLQIFVRKEDADSLAYASRPMGVPLQSFQSIREYAGQVPCKGQVRIYMCLRTATGFVRSTTAHGPSCAPTLWRAEQGRPRHGVRCIESFVGCSKTFWARTRRSCALETRWESVAPHGP